MGVRRKTVVRAIPDVEGRTGTPVGLAQILGPIKETLDIREGRVGGDALDKYVLWRDIVALGLAGAPGATSASSAGPEELFIRRLPVGASALNKFTMVAIDSSGLLVAADHTDLDHAACVEGMLIESAAAGSNGRVLVRGMVTSSAWLFTPQHAVFLGASGLLTQTPVTSGFHLACGWAKGPTTVYIDVEQPVVLP